MLRLYEKGFLVLRNLIISVVGVLLAISTSGCTSRPLPSVYQDKKVVSIPPFHQVSMAEVGENMYEKFNQDYFHVKILEEIQSDLFLEKYMFDDSKELRKWEVDNYNAVCTANYCLVDTENKGYFTHYATLFSSLQIEEGKLIKLLKPSKYEIVPVITQDSFKYVALYQGKIGNKINISFQEFKNNMMRAVFTQNIEYEINEHGNTVIGFKGLRIEVTKATNVNIEYSVTKDYR